MNRVTIFDVKFAARILREHQRGKKYRSSKLPRGNCFKWEARHILRRRYVSSNVRSNREDAILPGQDLSIGKIIVPEAETAESSCLLGRIVALERQRSKDTKREKICVMLRRSLNIKNFQRFPVLIFDFLPIIMDIKERLCTVETRVSWSSYIDKIFQMRLNKKEK